ncbi:MAG: SH3 domain-containing protein [Synergistaceae bacterium]|jgi:hypothetical protein|nr:SH3 domain-containing protein [Synergistaceae bacterium]
MDKRSTKERLDELDELLQGGYLTPTESRVARAHILRESGIDVEGAEEMEVSQGESRGCGCFLAALLLTLALLLGAALAVPEWPDSLGGTYVNAARGWVFEQCGAFWKKLFGRDDPNVVLKPAPEQPPVLAPLLVSADPPSRSISKDISVSLPSPESPETRSADPGLSSLPAIDSRTLNLPEAPSIDSSSTSPRVTVVEIPSSLSEDFPKSEPEPLRRGVISAQNVRIRSTPDASVNNNVIGTGRKGDRLLILKEATGKNQSKWYNIRYENGRYEGWISASLVALESQ